MRPFIWIKRIFTNKSFEIPRKPAIAKKFREKHNMTYTIFLHVLVMYDANWQGIPIYFLPIPFYF
jgi:hypothetical protein